MGAIKPEGIRGDALHIKLGIPEIEYQKILNAVQYFYLEEPEKELMIDKVAELAEAEIVNAKKVLYWLLYQGAIYVTFYPMCRCGFEGEDHKSAYNLAETCPICERQVIAAMRFWR